MAKVKLVDTGKRIDVVDIESNETRYYYTYYDLCSKEVAYSILRNEILPQNFDKE